MVYRKCEVDVFVKVEKIQDKDSILALVIRGRAWQEGLNFVSDAQDFQQIGFWKYNKGKKLSAHIHLVKPRQILRTQEVIFVKRGSLKADIYTEEEKILKSVKLMTGDTLVLLKGGHGYEILEDDTRVLEIKNGPYIGPENDRKRIG